MGRAMIAPAATTQQVKISSVQCQVRFGKGLLISVQP